MREKGSNGEQLYRALARAVWLAAGLFLLFWFLDLITATLLFFTLALILTLSLNPAVTWLEQKGIPRVAAALAVFFGLLAVGGLLAWLILPGLVDQVARLATDLPDYAASLRARVDRWLTRTPELEGWLDFSNLEPASVLPAAQSMLLRVGRYSLTAVTLVFMGILLASIVVFALVNPRPLLRGYLRVFPPHLRGPAARAFSRSSEVVLGWIRANLVVGSVNAVAAAIFLGWLGIPGAFVWASLALAAEMVPKISAYLMTVPPALVALAVDPMKAVWVVLFYVVLNELTGDFIAPVARGKSMDLHPVSTMFSVLAMTSAFGVLGALISTPVTGFVKAYYEEFYASRQPEDESLDEQVEAMLQRQTAAQRPTKYSCGPDYTNPE